MHEAHAELAELPGRERQPDGLAVDEQLAGVGLVEAGEDLDQRRLAGAVLPEEAVDLPGEHVEVDTAQRARPAEALRQVPQRETRRLRRGRPPLLQAPELLVAVDVGVAPAGREVRARPAMFVVSNTRTGTRAFLTGERPPMIRIDWSTIA